MTTETQDDGQISEVQAEIFNRQACEMVSIFFKELATITSEEIYQAASKGEGSSEVLLEVVNRVFTKFIENGEGIPRVYFDSYARTVDSFVHTFKLNITNRLEMNSEKLIVQALGKDGEEISYTDIAKATQPTVETEPVETVKEEA
tara:strand:+ start:7198 stop:7635 length:438 start_codon:yes stop_codon:yes gene_type:complete